MNFNKMVLTLLALPTILICGQTNIDMDIIEKEQIELIKINEEDLTKEVEAKEVETEEVIEEIVDIENTTPLELEKEIIKFNVNGILLKEGVAGEEVLRIKEFFKEKGYDDIDINYYLDNKTKNIIIDYQRKNGLSADGIVGKNTYQKINEDMEKNKISIKNIRPVFNLEIPKENFIIINKSNNTLYYLNNGVLINKFPVGTGKEPEYTPEGKFKIVNKYVNPQWGGAGRQKPIKGGASNNPLGKRWLGLNINGGGTYGIHGNSNKGSIGKYVSLGCVRMYNEDVEYLYKLIHKDTPVWIGNEEKLKDYGIEFL